MAPDENRVLRACFVPFLTTSHIIPLVDIAMLFAARRVDVTIITTHQNSVVFQKSIDKAIASGYQFNVIKLTLPAREVGLPEGLESFSSCTSIDLARRLFQAFYILQQPIEKQIRELRPDCLVADMHCFWATDLAAELGIPRLVFHARPFLALCAADAVLHTATREMIESDDELLVLPGLPDTIHMRKMELPDWIRVPNGYTDFVKKIDEANKRSFGSVVDSFYELEKNYFHHYNNVLGRRGWPIGPVWLCRKDIGDKTEHDCLKWLDTQKPDSVIYASFGTLSCFSSRQLSEIATAFGSLSHPFIWVVQKDKSEETTKWLPEGFDEKIANRGFIIRGWAPQVQILEHPAVGGFMTQCGSNSIMESITCGVPMATWPVSSEQFYNEKLVTRVLKIGVEVGGGAWTQLIQESTSFVDKERIEKAVNELMSREEKAEDRRTRAKELGEVARGAVDEGGSSYSNLTSLLDEIAEFSSKSKQT